MSAMTTTARKAGLTAAESFWYVLGCIDFGVAYLQKVPVKRALAEYGLTTLTAAEKFWYVLGCIAFGSAYFAKVSTVKALSELPQFAAPAPPARLEAVPQPPEAAEPSPLPALAT